MSTEQLHLGDFGMEEHRHEDIDLVWGFKSYRNEQNFVQFALEIRYRVPGSDQEVYLRETRVDDPRALRSDRVVVHDLMAQLVRVLTDADYRLEIHRFFYGEEA